jgi:hypothetical protein
MKLRPMMTVTMMTVTPSRSRMWLSMTKTRLMKRLMMPTRNPLTSHSLDNPRE